MIHYHGGPFPTITAAVAVWTRRHGFVSFNNVDQVGLAFEVCQSVAIDNGAFSIWRQGGEIDIDAYVAFVKEWERHPAFDFAILPDVIDGDEDANNLMIARYRQAGGDLSTGVPVWHMHESLERLDYLCRAYPRVALGSSGRWSQIGTHDWWQRIGEAMDHICDADGKPPCKLHGLRMLDPTIYSQLPLSSADSTNAAQNGSRQGRAYHITPQAGAEVLANRIEMHASASRWTRSFGVQKNLDLIG